MVGSSFSVKYILKNTGKFRSRAFDELLRKTIEDDPEHFRRVQVGIMRDFPMDGASEFI